MKKGFTLIELMIVVAIIAILAMIAVPMYQRYIERSRNSASQSTLQQIALAEVALDTAPEIVSSYVDSSVNTNIELLATFGFRPDPNVAFYIQLPTAEAGFVAHAVHIANGSQVFIYDNVNATGVVSATVTPGHNYPTGTSYVPGSFQTWSLDSAGSATPVMTCAAGPATTDNTVRTAGCS